MQKFPLVSVILLVHNGERSLTHAIKNINAQNYKSLEIIIVSDDNTDNFSEIPTELPNISRYVCQTNSRTSVARNQGIQKAKGDILGFLDMNSQWSSNALTSLINHLEKNPAVEIAKGMTMDVSFEQSEGENQAFEDILMSGQLTTPYYSVKLESAIYRKSVFDKVGLFDESLSNNEDIDWFVRAWQTRIIKSTIYEVTLFQLKDSSSMNLGKSMNDFDFLQVYKEYVKKLVQQKNSIFPSDFPSLNQYISYVSQNHIHLKNTNFSIISDDCWGGAAYKEFGLMYKTPFVGTKVMSKCYLKLLKNLKIYLEYPLEFSRFSRYESVNLQLKERYFPIGTLNNDVEIQFLHETDEKTAKDNWDRRLKRMNWDNIFVKCSDYWEEDFTPFLNEFEALDFSHKVCFTSKPYPEFSSAIFLPDFCLDAMKLFYICRSHFDVTGWLNKAFSSDTKAYQIKAESE